MARARNIKPALFKNELLGTADPLLTILFAGLWCLADRQGRLEDRPLRIKAEIFPYREIPSFNGYLTELQRLGFIHRYSVGELSIIQVLNFAKHQNPHKTEKQSELPEFCGETTSCQITVKAPLGDSGLTEVARLIPDSLVLIPDPLKIGDKSPSTSPGKGSPLMTLSTYVTERKKQGQKAIPDNHAVHDYAEQAGIPAEFLHLAWHEFKQRYLTPPDHMKRYRDWGAVFLKAVKGNWMKVWYIDGDQYKLTTVGLQAERARKNHAA